MALSDLIVYDQYARDTRTEVLAQQISLFNAASGGTITLSAGAHDGNFADSSFWAKVPGGVVRRRNGQISGTPIASKTIKQEEDTSVKIDAGTPEMKFEPQAMKRILTNPAVHGAVLGRQMAVDSMADMLNTSIGAAITAFGSDPGLLLNIAGLPTPPGQKITWRALNAAQAKMGDRAQDITTWVMHSQSLHALHDDNLINAQQLFTYKDINVVRDPFGKLIIFTDCPYLVVGGGFYATLGLTNGAIQITENNDFTSNETSINGFENIIVSYQAEWTWQLALKGFAWDKEAGGASPNDAALMSSGSWRKNVTSIKDAGGVVLNAKADVFV